MSTWGIFKTYRWNSKSKICQITWFSNRKLSPSVRSSKNYFWLGLHIYGKQLVDCVWNVMTHAQKPDFVLRRNGQVHLNRQEHRFGRLLAAEACALAVVVVVMLDMPCSEVVWRVMATHTIHQFLLHFSSRASPCAITFQLDSVYVVMTGMPVHMEQLVSRRTGLKLTVCGTNVWCVAWRPPGLQEFLTVSGFAD